MASEPEIQPLEPFVVQKIWGGERLAHIKDLEGLDHTLGGVGETWEVSALKQGPSRLDGHALCDLQDLAHIPYLAKLIDTNDNLSVQVHPGDDYAAQYENSKGKTECWLILEAGPNEGIYLGLKDGVSKEQLQKAIKSSENVNDLLVFYPVKKGDFFFVPAGAIHAIGTGVFLAEIQQSSGVTYRVWDWNRVDSNGQSRELHIDKAMDVINFDPQFNSPENFKFSKGLFKKMGKSTIINHEDFNVELINLKAGEEFHLSINSKDRPGSLLVLEGEGKIYGQENINLQSYRSYLINKNVKELNCVAERPLSLLYIF